MAITRPTALLAGGALLVGAAVGASGALALWRDADGVALPTLHLGQEYFAAGLDGAPLALAVAGDVVLEIDGPSLVQDVIDDGVAFRLFRVDSLSQGNKGLSYDVTSPVAQLTATGQPLASLLGPGTTPAVQWTRVADPAGCSATGVTPADSTLPRLPVSAAYSDGITPTPEYWCLWVAGTFSDKGEYDNTAGASGTAEFGGASPGPTVTASPDSWNAEVTTAADPADQDDAALTFSYETFRAGE